MPLVTRYVHLQKQDPGGDFRTFGALRSVGMAVDFAWKLTRDKGPGSVTKQTLQRFHVAGCLRVLSGGSWRRHRECDLELRSQDCAWAVSLFEKQKSLFADLNFNAFFVDTRGCDLLGSFFGPENFGLTGKVWVELNVFSEAPFPKDFAKLQDDLPQALARKQGRDSSLQGVLLVAVKVQPGSGGQWEGGDGQRFCFACFESALVAKHDAN